MAHALLEALRMNKWTNPLRRLATALLLASCASCVYDASDRCSAHQTFDPSSDSCVCDPDAPASGGACVPCASDDTRAACQKGPAGFGTPCTADTDCAGLEASHCETLQAHVCVVAGCHTSPDDCTGGQSCCDLNGLGVPLTLCLPPGQCPAN
jgi:hypothetical protein